MGVVGAAVSGDELRLFAFGFDDAFCCGFGAGALVVSVDESALAKISTWPPDGLTGAGCPLIIEIGDQRAARRRMALLRRSSSDG